MTRDTVILLHGLGRTRRSMERVHRRLEREGYDVLNLGYPSMRYSIDRLVSHRLSPAVDACRSRNKGAVHFVTHSLGGILVRRYLLRNTLSPNSRIVMLAPPSQGSELVEILRRTRLYRWVMGPAAMEIGTGPDSLPLQLGPIKVETGIVIGSRSLLPFSRRIFGGPNDGKVSVERARLPGMKDFLVVPAGHTFVMRKRSVLDQVVHFLKHGAFDHRSEV